jgi:outer membrane protein
MLLVGLSLSSIALQGQEAWSLEQCIARGLERNLDIQRSVFNRDLSKIDLKQGQFARLPNLSGGATHGYNWGQTIDPFTNEFATDRVRNNNLFLQSSVTLFNGFRIDNGIKQAEIDLQATELDMRRAQNDASLLIAQSYLDVLFAIEQLRAIEQQVTISERQVQRMERMVEVGQEALASLYDVRSQLASDQFTYTQAENNVAIAKLRLANLMLLDATETANFDIQAPGEEVLSREKQLFSVSEIYAQSLIALPEVQAAELRTASSEKGLAIARGSRSPSLSLQGSIGTGYSGNNIVPLGDPIAGFETIGVVESSQELVVAPDISFSGFETKGFGEQLDDNFNQSLSFRLDIPIFSRYNISSDISRAKINNDLNRLNEQDTRNRLLQNVQQAHADATASKRNTEAAELALEAMQLNFENAEKRFEQEMISTVDFNDAKSRLAQAEIDAIRAKYEYVFRMTIIDYYMGKTINLN